MTQEQRPFQTEKEYDFHHDYSMQANGIEEITYEEKIESVKIDLNQQNLSFEAHQGGDDAAINIEGSETKNIIELLDGNIVLNIEEAGNKINIWKTQQVLKGSSGNDTIMLEGRAYAGEEGQKKTELNATTGNDIYIGDIETEKISYENIPEDALTGLHITNKAKDITIVKNNMPPLVVAEYEQDELLVYKNYDKYESGNEIDLLKNIDILRATDKDDTATLFEGMNTTINFLEGVDRVKIYSKSLDNALDKIKNAETIEWINQTKSIEGNETISKEQGIIFDVIGVLEDEENRIDINDALTSLTHKDDEWHIQYVDESQNEGKILSEWVDLKKVAATPEQIGQGKIVIYTELKEDGNEDANSWLEIHTQDLRDEGRGLIGLDLDLSWNNDSFILREEDIQKNNFFEDNQLPLFQNKGSLDIIGNRYSIKNITAAALPRANTGIALGNNKDPIPQTLFAKIQLKKKDENIKPEFKIDINAFPAAAGKEAKKEDLMILDDPHRKHNWILDISPKQAQVGKHVLAIQSKTEESASKHIIVDVVNKNDPPTPVNDGQFEGYNSSLKIKEGEEFDHELSKLFKDEDGEKLDISLLSGPEWININKETQILTGIAPFDSGKEVDVVIIAKDSFGQAAESKIKIKIENTNQPPKTGEIIGRLEAKQGQLFTYRLSESAFVDIDINERTKDSLKYSIIESDESKGLPQWLNIDSNDGALSGIATNNDVGIFSFKLRATDKDGRYAEQEVEVKVLNVNDAPRVTDDLNKFVSDQLFFASESSIDLTNSNAIFLNEESTFDLTKWFSDPDMQVDTYENLEFNIYLEGENEEKILVGNTYNNAKGGWLKYEKASKEISFMPRNENLGKHYIIITALDKAGDSTSATVPITINWKNQKPTVNIDKFFENPQEKANGIKNISLSNSENKIIVELEESMNIQFQIPNELFVDPDMEINAKEALNFELISDSEHNDAINFNENQLMIGINTNGLGIDSPSGYVEWSTKLICRDQSGEEAEINILLSLQRSVHPPNIRLNTVNNKVYDEGYEIELKNIIDIDSIQHPDHRFNLLVRHKKKNDGQELDLIKNEIFSMKPIVNTDARKEWKLFGELNEIKNQIQQIIIKTTDGATIAEEYELEFIINTQLGETGIKSDAKTISTNFKYEALPSMPIWKYNGTQVPSDKFELKKLGDYINASIEDKGEELSYIIKTPNNNDISITDINGKVLGLNNGDLWLLEEEEWSNAIIRSKSGDTQVLDIDIQAQSKEKSNGRIELGKIKRIKWLASPILNNGPKSSIEIPQHSQVAGEKSSIEITLRTPVGAKSAHIELILPKESRVFIQGKEIKKEEINKFDDKFKWALEDKYLDSGLNILELEIQASDLYSGEYTGEYKILTSTREGITGQTAEAIESDKENLLARESESIEFKWNIHQVAKKPEIRTDSEIKEENLGFNPENQKITIPFRRGKSNDGIRNKNEELIISLNNIPNGYTLAQKINEKYVSIGATDELGTMTLFSINKSNKTLEQLENYELLNDGNLYLVGKGKDSGIIKNDHRIHVSIISSIEGQSNVNTRSEEVTKEIILSAVDINNRKYLSSEDQFVDPLIIDLSGTNELSLTKIEENKEGITYEMIPGIGAVNTAWIDGDNNSAGFIVSNDSTDDDQNTIKSTKEILSEYFQSNNGARSYNSGSDALMSFDSNKDQKINKEDENWDKLQVWIDNGDAVSKPDELFKLEQYIDEIDLSSIKALSENPEWANENNILRQAVGYKNNQEFRIYDVGFQVRFNKKQPLHLDITRLVNMDEQGDHGSIQLTSKESKNWLDDRKDKLTLIRVSGLPSGLIPSLGIKDSRNDWLFTWSDLDRNNGVIDLIADNNLSGKFNIQIMLSQVQKNGTMRSSAIKTMAIDIKGVADKPSLITSNQSIYEDGYLYLSDIINDAQLRDKDGSENLSFKLTGLKEDWNLISITNRQAGMHKILDNGIEFMKDDISNLALLPTKHISGNFQINVHAIAKEKYSNSTAETIGKVDIYITAKVDAPNQLTTHKSLPKLRENEAIGLDNIFIRQKSADLLNDTDGSEELRVKLELPSNFILFNSIVNDWVPLNIEKKDNGISTYIINHSDLEYLSLKGTDVKDDEITIRATTISREISTGEQQESSSDAINVRLSFIRDAKPAQVVIKDASKGSEDGKGWILGNLIDITKESKSDELSLQIHKISKELEVQDEYGKKIEGEKIDIDTLNKISVKPKLNTSGDASIHFMVLSTPLGGGKAAYTGMKQINLSVEAIADKPTLLLNENHEQIKISSTGWLDIGQLIKSMNSDDQDGSEDLFLVLSSTNEKGETIPLPINSKLNALTAEYNDNIWTIPKGESKNLKLFLGIIDQSITLNLGIRSKDGKSTKDGNKFKIVVPSNRILRSPILNISSDLQGGEDEYIPLMQKQGGIIEAQLRDGSLGQSLSLKLSEIPKGITLARRTIDGDGNVAYNSVLNEVDLGTNKSELILDYSQWDSVYMKGPANESGVYSFNIKSIAHLGEKSKEGQTKKIVVNIAPINDKPSVKDAGDLSSINEGSLGKWNLRDKFWDVDNESEELKIAAKILLDDGSKINLPNWLQLSSSGILSGIPSNNDVGQFRLEVTATDPEGQQAQITTQLRVGNVNNTPYFHHDFISNKNWQSQQDQDGKVVYSKDILLRESLSINLLNSRANSGQPNGLFSDPDAAHEEQKITFTLSDKDQSIWSNEINKIAKIEGNILKIFANSKNHLGNQVIFLRATDREGASIIQELRLNIININDPPKITRQDAILIGNQIWEESIEITQDHQNWTFNPNNLFVDEDPGDRLSISGPQNIPSWINIDNDGIFRGVPRNNDVGDYVLVWRAMDKESKSAYFRLNLKVKNINKGPQSTGSIKYIESTEDGYKKINLHELFIDEDEIHGDSLSYKLKVFDPDNEEIEKPDWMKINYALKDLPNLDNQLLVQPVIYLAEDNGAEMKKLSTKELDSLDINTLLNVKIKASDFRAIDRKGIIGVDLDISWNNNLKLVSNSIQISDKLPLFNKVIETENGLRINAGSAPDALNVGDAVGINDDDDIVSFNVRLSDPKDGLDITVTPGQGSQRDGLLDRYGQRLDNVNSYIHQYSTRAGAFLDILSPPNNAVGQYQIELVAEDDLGMTTKVRIPIEVENINDKPIINISGERVVKEFFEAIETEQTALREDQQIFLPYTKLFNDEDSQLGRIVNEKLDIQLETRDGKKIDGLSINSSINGDIELSLRPTKGITSYVKHELRMIASDQEGETVKTDWFRAFIKPTAEKINLTTGSTQKELKSFDSYFEVNKNTKFDIARTLELNNVKISDPQGDNAVLMISVPYISAEVTINEKNHQEVVDKLTTNEGARFKISLKELANITGKELGDLSGLILNLPNNQMMIMPSNRAQILTPGIPIEIWTESNVSGDEYGEKFNITKTEPVAIWVKLNNHSPTFNQPNIINLSQDNGLKPNGRVLIDLNELFTDLDKNDLKVFEIIPDDQLKDFIQLDSSTNELKLSDEVVDMEDIPNGIHRIGIRMKDSSGIVGDRSGFVSGQIRLLVKSNNDKDQTRLGLQLLSTIDSTSISNVLSSNENELSNDEVQLKAVLKELEIIPSVDNINTISNDDIEKAKDFIAKVQSGGATILTNSNLETQGLLILEAHSDDNILINSSLDVANAQTLSDSRSLLEVGSNTLIEAPIGEIDFAVDTQGQDSAVVKIQLPGDVKIDSLVKTTQSGDPFKFNTTKLEYTEDLGDLDSWISQLKYNIYNYSMPGDDQEIVLQISPEKSVQQQLSKLNFDIEKINQLDGSAFLIDTNSDGMADILSMMLLDQGWFDTRSDEIGLIGDPLTPIQLKTIDVSSDANGNGVNDQATSVISNNIVINNQTSSVISDDDGINDQTTSVISDDDGINDQTTSVISDDDGINDQTTSVISDDDGINDQTTSVISDDDGINDQTTSVISDDDGINDQTTSVISDDDGINDQTTSVISDDDGINIQTPSINSTNLKPGALIPANPLEENNNLKGNKMGTSSPPGTKDKEQNASNISANTRIDSPVVGNNADITLSKSDYVEIKESNNKNILQGIRNMLNSFAEQRTGILDNAINTLLGKLDANNTEKDISSILALLMFGIGADRLAQNTLKSVHLPKKLSLARRSHDFKGDWIIPNQNGKTIKITSKNLKLSFQSIDGVGNTINKQHGARLSGFDEKGNSWLYNSIMQNKKISGELLASIEIAFYQLKANSRMTTNWEDWIDRHFPLKDLLNKKIKANDEVMQIAQLKSLLRNIQDGDPAMKDVIMFGQLYDCCERLGIYRMNKFTNR